MLQDMDETIQEKMRSHQIESAVLSIFIRFNETFDDFADKLTPSHFTSQINRSIFVELRKLLARGGCDVLSLADALKGSVDLSEIHAVAVSHDHTSAGLKRFVDTLIDKEKERELYRLSSRMADLAFEHGPIQTRIDAAMSELSKLADTADTQDWVDAYTASIEHTHLLEEREAGKLQGLSTGLHDLDEMLHGGMHRGNLVVIGARPAMGKTALAMTIGLDMARHSSVGFLSMEMPHSDVRDRQAAILGRASISHIKRPSKGLEFDRIVEGVEKSRQLRFFVSDKSGLNILNVRSMARNLKRKSGLDVLIVDYIGLMNGLDARQPRAYQIEEISRGLKTLAKELDIAVICLAQVRRGEDPGRVPGLSDLRDSGAIEQDADVVGFIHRPIAAKPELTGDWIHYALLRVAKNRQGRTGDVHLFYNGEYTHFDAWSGAAPSLRTDQSSSHRGARNEL